jgi:DNA-binding NarL/FixJ family response regulator
MQESKINLLIIDDHQLIIDGIKGLLQDESDIDLILGANNMAQAIDVVNEHRIQVALVDISMPENSGIDVTRKLKEISPETKVLALTMHEDIQNITDMIEAGASGYIFKRTSMDEVLEAIRTVARNEKYLSRNVQAVLVDSMKHKSEVNQNSTEKEVNLSAREREILGLIAREFNNEAIAKKLFISERTVEAHRRNIFTKTKTKTIVGLMKFAMKHQLIDFNNEL